MLLRIGNRHFTSYRRIGHSIEISIDGEDEFDLGEKKEGTSWFSFGAQEQN